MGRVMLRVWTEVDGGLCGPCTKHRPSPNWVGEEVCDVFHAFLCLNTEQKLVRCVECLQAESKSEHQAGA